MFKEVDVIFFVEHKDRELESIELICSKLKEQGIKTIILSTFFHLIHLYFYRPKIVVFPYLMSQKDWPVELVYSLYSDNIKYINMNWEQLLSTVNQEYKKPQDKFVKEQVIQLSWDKNFGDDFLVKNGVKEENIKIVGNLANELLYNLLDKKNEWRDFISKEFELDINKKWLFMPMNYGWAFASDKLILGKISAGYDENIAWKYRAYSQKCLKEFVYFIEKLSKEYTYEIIIRPHPSIIEEQYKEVFIEEIGYIPKNIYLNKAHSIREWIIASDIIGSSWSTSVWDAYNVGKPVFLFTPFKRPEWLNVWWNDVVVNLEKYDEILISSNKKNIEKIKTSNNIASLITDLLKEHKSYKNKLSFVHPKLILLLIMRYLSCKFFKCKLFSKYTNSVKYDYFIPRKFV